MGNEHRITPLMECGYQYFTCQLSHAQREESTPYWDRPWGVGEAPSVLRVLRWAFVLLSVFSPAALAGSRTLTWEMEGSGYPNTHVASEIEGIVRRRRLRSHTKATAMVRLAMLADRV